MANIYLVGAFFLFTSTGFYLIGRLLEKIDSSGLRALGRFFKAAGIAVAIIGLFTFLVEVSPI